MLRPLILLFLLVSIQLTAGEKRLHVCTVASHSTKGLEQLLDSCNRNGVTIDVLGFGMPFRGMSEKLLHVQNYLEALPEKDIVLFVDAYDVLILDNPDSILKKFKRMKAPFVISVERFCWPLQDRYKDFPQGPTSFRYINSGSYIGYVGAIKKIFQEMGPIRPQDDDQGLFMHHYFKYPEKYRFDSYCKLFMVFAGVIFEEMKLDVKNGTVKCGETGTIPSIIHGAGGTKPLYQHIYEILFQDKPF